MLNAYGRHWGFYQNGVRALEATPVNDENRRAALTLANTKAHGVCEGIRITYVYKVLDDAGPCRNVYHNAEDCFEAQMKGEEEVPSFCERCVLGEWADVAFLGAWAKG